MENNSIEQFAAYLERCKKWEPLMTDLRPLAEAEVKMKRNTKEQIKAAVTLGNARHSNIANMIRKAWPKLHIKINHLTGWGSDYTVSYFDGPTLSDFTAAIDLDLFQHNVDSNATDGIFIKKDAHTEFADRYMCMYNGVDIEVIREQSQQSKIWMLNKLRKTLSGTPHDINDHITTYRYTAKQIAYIASVWGCNGEKLFNSIKEESPITVERLVEIAFDICDHYNLGWWIKSNINEHPKNTIKNSNKPPAAGLTLEKISDGVAMICSRELGIKNRELIRAHGAHWNKDAKQWQATDPEEIQRLREWFKQ